MDINMRLSALAARQTANTTRKYDPLSGEDALHVQDALNRVATEIHRFAFHRGERLLVVEFPEELTRRVQNYTRKIPGEEIVPEDALNAPTYYFLKGLQDAGYKMQQSYVGPMKSMWSHRGPQRLVVTW